MPIIGNGSQSKARPKTEQIARIEPSHLAKVIDGMKAPETLQNEVLWRADFSTPGGRRTLSTPKSPSPKSRNCY